MSKKTWIEDEAIRIVDNERAQWRDAVCYITEDVGFKMRDLIRVLRKNYWGVFEEAIDPHTGREKVWFPLSMSLVEDFLKNIDLDQKDINFRAKNPDAYELTDVTRAAVRDYLDRVYFGETLDSDERTVLIDGTVVWKTWEENKNPKRQTIDLLNVYIDPTEDSIQSAYRFTTRSLALPSEIAQMDGWMDTKNIKGSTVLSKHDMDNLSLSSPTTGQYQDVWDMWGKIPLRIITGKKKDTEEVDGHIILSGLESGDKRVHLIELNKTKDKFGNAIKPYEEWRAAKIAGRWYGLGLVERVLALQEYMNIVGNIRINRSYVSQLGLFKIRKGQGITAQMLSRLASNGAIQVQNQDDVEQMPIADVPMSSYKDEEVIEKWSQRITSAYQVASGETLPSSATATSVAIANTNAKSAFTMFKEGTGLFLERWIERHALPIIAKNIKVGDLVRMKSDDMRYKELADRIVGFYAQQELDALYAQGQLPTMETIDQALSTAMQELMKRPELFLETSRKIIAESVDPEVIITNEELDVPVTVSNLTALLPAVPEYKDAIIPQLFDLLGLERPQKAQTALTPEGAMPSPQSLQGVVTSANVNGQV